MVSKTQLLVGAAVLSQATANIIWHYPAPRVDKERLVSNAQSGPRVCGGDTCNAFCGHRPNDPNSPVTEIEVGVNVEISWNIGVPMEPYTYRVALNGAGTGDDGFDLEENLIMSVGPMDAIAGFAEFTLTQSMKIPERFLTYCNNPDSPCSLQLYDMYRYVSCANIVLTKNGQVNVVAPPDATTESEGRENDVDSVSVIEAEPTGNGPTFNVNGANQYPVSVTTNGKTTDYEVKLLSGGLCPDIGGDCTAIMGGSCQGSQTETSFGYSDNPGEFVIYATHFGGQLHGRGNGKDRQCRDLSGTNFKQGCLTAMSTVDTRWPQKSHHIREGAGVALFECKHRVTQRFRYTKSGKFQITHPRNGNTFCLGMDEPATPGGERRLALFSCEADGALITWKVTPEPKNPVDDVGFLADNPQPQGWLAGWDSLKGGNRNLRAE